MRSPTGAAIPDALTTASVQALLSTPPRPRSSNPTQASSLSCSPLMRHGPLASTKTFTTPSPLAPGRRPRVERFDTDEDQAFGLRHQLVRSSRQNGTASQAPAPIRSRPRARRAETAAWHASSAPGYGYMVRPISETLEALGELDPYLDDGTLADQLTQQAAAAQEIAPDLIGVSVAIRIEDLTFTLVASDDTTAALDAVQYVSAGPCVEAFDREHGIATEAEDLFDESRWQTFGRASAAAGVRSTLTYPVFVRGQLTGTGNLYGGSERAFDGKYQALADVFGAWAPGAVKNADLSFSTRRLAQQAPQQLRDQALIETAIGYVAEAQDLEIDAAREHLEEAARRAGIPVATLARAIIER